MSNATANPWTTEKTAEGTHYTSSDGRTFIRVHRDLRNLNRWMATGYARDTTAEEWSEWFTEPASDYRACAEEVARKWLRAWEKKSKRWRD